MLKDLASKMVTPGAKRESVAHAREYYGLSEHWACNLLGASRRVIRYQSSRTDDGPLRERLRELAVERRRFGYRRLGYLLAREGKTPNHKKLLRVYREENLRVRRRGCRKRLGNQGTDGVARWAEPALVAGLHLRHADVQPPVPTPVRGR